MDHAANQKPHSASRLYFELIKDHQLNTTSVPVEKQHLFARHPGSGEVSSVQQAPVNNDIRRITSAREQNQDTLFFDPSRLFSVDETRNYAGSFSPWLSSSFLDSGQSPETGGHSLDWPIGTVPDQVASRSATVQSRLFMPSDIAQTESGHPFAFSSSSILDDFHPPSVSVRAGRLNDDLSAFSSRSLLSDDQFASRECINKNAESDSNAWIGETRSGCFDSDPIWSSKVCNVGFNKQDHQPMPSYLGPLASSCGFSYSDHDFKLPSSSESSSHTVCSSNKGELFPIKRTSPSLFSKPASVNLVKGLLSDVGSCETSSVSDSSLSTLNSGCFNPPSQRINCQQSYVLHSEAMQVVQETVKPKSDELRRIASTSGAVEKASAFQSNTSGQHLKIGEENSTNLDLINMSENRATEPNLAGFHTYFSNLVNSNNSDATAHSTNSSFNHQQHEAVPSVQQSFVKLEEASFGNSNTNHHSEYGLYFKDDHEPCVKQGFVEDIESIAMEKLASKGCAPDNSSSKVATGARPAKKQVAEKLFFDPRRIFAADNRQKHFSNKPATEHSMKGGSGSGCQVINDRPPQKVDDTSAGMSNSDSVSHSPSETTNTLPTRGQQESQLDDQPSDLLRERIATDCSSNFERCRGRADRESVINRHSRNKHTGRRRTANFKHVLTACETRHSRRKSAAHSSTNGGDSEVNTMWNKIWTKIDGQHLRQVLESNASEFFSIFLNMLKIVVGIIVFEFMTVLESAWNCTMQVLSWILAITQRWRKSKQMPEPKGCSLSENIILPTTGEEAMRRLFALKGKDPYSILGLKADCSEEEIKRYYRRQAVLVHPDKNREPGAEEAFKILNHAFEMIGEPDKRQLYDIERVKENENDAAMQEFTDLLTKLHQVMKETINLMPCNNCGGKHRRYPVNVTPSEARYCARCNDRHAAKEGDVWAESSALGFRWHYFACIDGEVYNITEWAKCQHDDFKHLKSNSHFVMMHISTGGKTNNRSATASEADLEQFLSSVFASASSNGASPKPFSSPFFQSPPSSGASHAQSGQSSATNAAAAKGKRRKKRK